jgi:hypothetical protein
VPPVSLTRWIAKSRMNRNAVTVVSADPARLMPFEVTVAKKRVRASSSLFMCSSTKPQA